ARLVRDGEDELEIEVEADGETLLVVRDVAAPGWRARVNGRLVPVVTVDHAFRGVVVPSGRSTVAFNYAPTALTLGAAASLVGIALALGLGAWARTARPWEREGAR
ncbi:MAG: YfhO family protein, partial [Nitriliruptorales bacterium]